jgi:antitoxin VapB
MVILVGNRKMAYAWAYVRVTERGAAVSAERHVKLFQNGRNQAVRIPREFELPGVDAIMRKDGNKLIIEPVPPRSLLALLATLHPLGEEIPLVCDEPPDEVNI